MIGVFIVCKMKDKVFSYPLRTAKTDQTGQIPRLILVLHVARHKAQILIDFVCSSSDDALESHITTKHAISCGEKSDKI